MNDTGSNAARQRVIPRLFAAIGLVMAIGAGCREGSAPRRAAGPPAGRVALLKPAVSNEASAAFQAAVAQAFAQVSFLAMSDGESALAECRRARQVLVIPQVRDVPTAFWPTLTNHLAQGGAVLFWGTDPFASRMEGLREPVSGRAFARNLALQAAPVAGLSEVQAWRHVSSTAGRSGAMRVDQSQELPWPAVLLEATNFVSWDALVREPVPADRLPPGANSLAFYARADVRTTQLSVECDEEDGSRWGCLVPVTTGWQLITLHEAQFDYLWGGRDRGGAGDAFALARIARAAIGLSMHLAPQAPGAHAYGVSDVRVFTDPRTREQVGEGPDLPLLSPAFRRYDLNPAHLQWIEGEEEIPVSVSRAQSPLPRPARPGPGGGAPYRWIPLVRAVDAAGDVVGWPLSLYLEPQPGRATRQWGWLAIDPDPAHPEALVPLLREATGRLAAGRFLFNSGADRFVFRVGDTYRVTAQAVRGLAPTSSLRVSSELLDARGSVTRRVSEPLAATLEEGEGAANVSLGKVSRVSGNAADLTLRLTLWDAADKTMYDVVEQPLRVAPVDGPAPTEARISVAGAGFVLGRRPLHVFGVNYWPLSTTGRRPGEFNPHWLDARVFDPDLIRRDLDRLQEAGLNSVAIQYSEESQAPQLLYFLDEIRARNMWVHLYIAGLSPLELDVDRARRLAEAIQLPRQTCVFALDLAWEPRLGLESDRSRLDADWRAWLIEQFGSVRHAEEVLGRPLWRRDGDVTGPPDRELALDDEAHRVAVAAYRRFVDDWVSRRYGAIRRFLAQLGCRQLLSARSGFGGTGNAWADPYFPLDLASGAVHLDFLCPEGWGLAGAPSLFEEAGFLTAYARGFSGGKPVVWVEYGLSVGARPAPQDLDNQARVYQQFLDLFLNSHAAGSFAWWYPGGLRVDERSDMGLVQPDSTWRPVGEVLRGFNQRLRREQSVPLPWRGRTVRRSDHARGISALWEAWRAEYGQEMRAGRMEELRPEGFGRSTRELPVKAVGGAAYAEPAPLEYVNAEWGALTVGDAVIPRWPGEAMRVQRRDMVRLELINTGPATWAASAEGQGGTVWVRARRARAKDQMISVRETPFGERATLTWLASDTGQWTLQPWLSGTGPFGEPLHVDVSESGVPAGGLPSPQ